MFHGGSSVGSCCSWWRWVRWVSSQAAIRSPCARSARTTHHTRGVLGAPLRLGWVDALAGEHRHDDGGDLARLSAAASRWAAKAPPLGGLMDTADASQTASRIARCWVTAWAPKTRDFSQWPSTQCRLRLVGGTGPHPPMDRLMAGADRRGGRDPAAGSAGLAAQHLPPGYVARLALQGDGQCCECPLQEPLAARQWRGGRHGGC